MKIVSLGSCCCTTYLQLAFSNIFEKSGNSPFDWVATPNFEKLIIGIKEKFIHLDNFSKNENPYYPTFDQFNDIYDIICPHYSISHYLEIFQRRYDRMMNDIESDEYVLFIHKHHKGNDILMTFDDCFKLYETIKGPKNILLVINEMEDEKPHSIEISIMNNIIFINTYGIKSICANRSRHYWNFIIQHIRSFLEYKTKEKILHSLEYYCV